MFKKSVTSVPRVLNRGCSFFCNTNMPYVPPFQYNVMPNGIRFVAEQTATPLTCMSLFVEAGPRFEIACNNGVTHFIEHMADKGVRGSSHVVGRDAFYMNFVEMGAKLTIKTSREIQEFRVTCPAEAARCAMSYLAHMVTELAASQEDLDFERQIIFEELIDYEKNAKKVMFDFLHQSAFQGTPLAQRVIGPSANVEAFTEYFLNTYLREHYQPYRLVLAVSGPTDVDHVRCMADVCFGSLVPTSNSQEYGPCRYTGSSITYRDDSMRFAHVAIAVEAPAMYSPEYTHMKVLAAMMGRWNRSMGGGYKAWPELAQAAAVCDLCDSYRPFYFAYRDVGLWGVYFVAETLDLEDVVYNIQDRWMKMCSTIVEPDVERALARYKFELAKNVEGSINSCRDMGLQLMYRCKRSSVLDQYELLKDLRVDALRATADKYLYNRCPVVAAVGPIEGLPEYNRVRSGMYWLRL